MTKHTFFPLVLIAMAGVISGATPPPEPPPVPPQSVAPDGELAGLFGEGGKVDPAAYKKVAHLWGPQSINLRLGPTFDQLNPNAEDDRPTLYMQPSRSCELSFANKINPYELGAEGCMPDNDYWSESGQVAYVPDDPVHDRGIDRIQVFAYYNHVFALSPRLDFASGRPHNDPQTREIHYQEMLGHYPQHPVAMARSYSMLQNEALVVYREGLLAVLGTQTSRGGNERPFPGLMFPTHKVPTGLAMTASNEFALVTIWDTETQRGQLAVVALEGKYLPFHTWPYMALPNQGSFSDFKLLGYVDLPMAAPSSVSAASNGFWGGPSQTANRVLSQIDLKDDSVRQSLDRGELGWISIIAKNGYALVASKTENKVVIVDLTPLFKYVRKSYLSSKESFEATTANRGSGPGQWPATFEESEEIKPRVIWEKTVPSPTAVLAGLKIDRWSEDHYKAYIASEDGTIRILDTSSLMARYKWEKSEKLKEIGTVKVGRNPVSMVFTRFGARGLPLLPKGNSDPLNNTFYVACRGDREVVGVVTWNGKGEVFRRIRDSRMGDPVALNVASRGNILTVADYYGKKILSFRIGAIVDRHKRFYGAGEDGKAPFEFCGEMPVAGHPFIVSSINVN